MPHIIIEYSENLEQKINLDTLIEKIHISALDTGIFPLGGLRIRAAKRE